MVDNYINCHYCGARILDTAPFCSQCGGPNQPDPLPWMASVLNRVKTSFKARTKNVWADRLASLMPLHFIVALITLGLAVIAGPAGAVPTIFVILMSITSLLAVLIYYPGWYLVPPEKRMDYGLIYFLVLIIYVITVIL